ncbi:hypothetical protein [Streptomyces tendae]|uniref:hypothetical protein n=1 Tax=Streptomyces tendae TaxID=1932 RepID=UPI0033F0FFE2
MHPRRGTEEAFLVEVRRASRADGPPERRLRDDGGQKAASVFPGRGEARAHDLAVEQSAHLVDGIATMAEQGERADMHSGTQSDRWCVGEPFTVVADERCVQVFQQRVDQPCDVLGRHDEDGSISGVLECTGPVSWILQANVGQHIGEDVIQIGTDGRHLRFRNLAVALHIHGQERLLRWHVDGRR